MKAPAMRLSESQRKIITESVTEVFGQGVTVRLFGSRTDDLKKGGDIDLFVEIPSVDPLKTRKSVQLSGKISRRLDDMIAVDVIVKDDSTRISLIHREGMRGIRL
jgi:predicted nucleotidyltransferase